MPKSRHRLAPPATLLASRPTSLRAAALTIPYSRFPIPCFSGNHEHRFVEFHGLAVLDQDGLYGAGDFGFDLVEHLHRLDHAQGVAGLDLLRSEEHTSELQSP